MSKLVCPTDRQLALRAKLNTGWSIHTDKPTSSKFELSAEEKQEIINVIRRAETIEHLQNTKMQQHLERIANMTKFAVGDGIKQCYICSVSFGLFSASRKECSYCKKATCDKCAVQTDSSVYKFLLLCKICSEKRELWKRSGTWLFKEAPPELRVASHQNTQSVPTSPGPSSTRLRHVRHKIEALGGRVNSSSGIKNMSRLTTRMQISVETNSSSCNELTRRIGAGNGIGLNEVGDHGRLNSPRATLNGSRSPSPSPYARKSLSDQTSPAQPDSTSTSPAAYSVSSHQKEAQLNRTPRAVAENRFNYSLQSVIAYLKTHQREGRASPLTSTSHEDDTNSVDEPVSYELLAENGPTRPNRASSIVPADTNDSASHRLLAAPPPPKPAIPKWASASMRVRAKMRDSPKLSVTDDSSASSSPPPSDSDANAVQMALAASGKRGMQPQQKTGKRAVT